MASKHQILEDQIEQLIEKLAQQDTPRQLSGSLQPLEPGPGCEAEGSVDGGLDGHEEGRRETEESEEVTEMVERLVLRKEETYWPFHCRDCGHCQG